MRFCPQCGAPLTVGAKYCVECGRALQSGPPSGAGRAAGPRTLGDLSLSNIPITTAFVAVFLAITIVGLGAAGWIMLGTPNMVRELAGAPPASTSSSTSVLSSGAPEQAANATSGGDGSAQTQAGKLPPGHPKIELPTEARTFIDKVERDARTKPNDVIAWTRFGAVAMRAAMFDQSYYPKAEEAYGHVLKLAPDNLDALRGIGDIDYDKKNYDQAVAAYEHYLKRKPDDPEVRTDLGTMYLDTGNADQAVVQYQKAIKSNPGFYQAYYNMGVAYAEQNQPAKANAALAQALKLAPDEAAKSQVRELIAKLGVATGGGAEVAASERATSAPGASPAAAPAAAAKANTFQGAIEQMVRNLPVAGPKVGTVLWPGQLKARVMMENFPMDQMPPFAKDKFLTDLKDGIDSAKKQYGVSSKVEVDIVDGLSGTVMQTMTE
ncbi:MAG TPA: tetratricopeptide repeat protein [Candidatus Binataceae bacterium]